MFRRTLMQCLSSNPDTIRSVLGQMALYAHVGPFSRDVIGRVETMIAELEPGVDALVPVKPANANFGGAAPAIV